MTIIIKAFETPDGETVHYSDEIEIEVHGRPNARHVMGAVDRSIEQVRRKVAYANASAQKEPLR